MPLDAVDVDTVTDVFNVKKLGPLVLFQNVRPLLEKAKTKWVSVTSAAGSIDNLEVSKAHIVLAYGIAKAGLNWSAPAQRQQVADCRCRAPRFGASRRRQRRCQEDGSDWSRHRICINGRLKYRCLILSRTNTLNTLKSTYTGRLNCNTLSVSTRSCLTRDILARSSQYPDKMFFLISGTCCTSRKSKRDLEPLGLLSFKITVPDPRAWP
ncbi:hypothetical protein V1517DRAFT_375218 [Lipomyces orientalis]|uniref:Uncharacterized protein n=1 Tax=Lipomyces orientalis TaxID=1233043 RepID=A0ACC3TJP2_9ASCO